MDLRRVGGGGGFLRFLSESSSASSALSNFFPLSVVEERSSILGGLGRAFVVGSQGEPSVYWRTSFLPRNLRSEEACLRKCQYFPSRRGIFISYPMEKTFPLAS